VTWEEEIGGREIGLGGDGWLSLAMGFKATAGARGYDCVGGKDRECE